MIIGIRGYIVGRDDNFSEGVVDPQQRGDFLFALFTIREAVSRLDVILFHAIGSDKIDFELLICRFVLLLVSYFHYADIHEVSAHPEFIIDDVLHDVRNFLLAKIEPCIAQSHVDGIVLFNALVISASFYIISAGALEKERVFEARQVMANRLIVDFEPLHTLEGVDNAVGIRQRAYGRAE